MRTVIMGGSSGIGLAAAETLTRSGIEVTVTGRDETKLAAIRDRVAGAVQLDGTDRAAVAEFFAGYGEFEHLVLAFSPGAGAFGAIRELSMEAIETAFSGKLFAYLHAIREARVTESVTMISAASARSAMPGTVALAAVNGSIERAVSPLAAELAPVRVNAVSPGVIDTPWWAFLPEAERRAQFEAIAGDTPVGRIGRAADVADAINYIVHAGFVTATVVPVDGGITVA